MNSRLTPTPIVNKNGVATTVHRRVDSPSSVTKLGSIPSPAPVATTYYNKLKSIGVTFYELTGIKSESVSDTLVTISPRTIDALYDTINSTESTHVLEILKELVKDGKEVPIFAACKTVNLWERLSEVNRLPVTSGGQVNVRLAASVISSSMHKHYLGKKLDQLNDKIIEDICHNSWLEIMGTYLNVADFETETDLYKGLQDIQMNREMYDKVAPQVMRINKELKTLEDGREVQDFLRVDDMKMVARYCYENPDKVDALTNLVRDRKQLSKGLFEAFKESPTTALSDGLL